MHDLFTSTLANEERRKMTGGEALPSRHTEVQGERKNTGTVELT